MTKNPPTDTKITTKNAAQNSTISVANIPISLCSWKSALFSAPVSAVRRL